MPIYENSAVVGGKVYAGTFTSTVTGFGYGAADAGAVAVGETSYTNTRTKTNVKEVGSINSSRADAMAKAYARTGNHIASSLSNSSSISIYVTNLW